MAGLCGLEPLTSTVSILKANLQTMRRSECN